MKQDYYIGSYADENMEGILRISFELATGQVSKVKGWRGVHNPSWILPGLRTLSGDRRAILYAVNEDAPEGSITAFVINDGNNVTKKVKMTTRGAGPCHLSINDNGEYLFVSNYVSGSLSMFRLDEFGVPTEMSDLLQYKGKGTNPIRQEGPHIHFSQFYQDELLVVNLGLDEIARYNFDRESGSLHAKKPFIHLPEGYGPRQFIFSPVKDRLYVVCELSSMLCVYEHKHIKTCNDESEHPGNGKQDGRTWEKRTLQDEYQLIQEISTLPNGYESDNLAAAIRISADGRHLFISNRGDDSITVFRIDNDGKAEYIQTEKTGGRIPRDFCLVGAVAGEEADKSWLIIANQESRNVTVLSFDEKSEKLNTTDRVLAIEAEPTCIQPA